MTPNERNRIIKELEEKRYGYMPPHPIHLYESVTTADRFYADSMATYKKLNLTAEMQDSQITIAVHFLLPNSAGAHPLFIYINDSDLIPNKFLPAEEILDRRYAILTFNAESVATRDDKFKGDITRRLSPKRRGKNAPGKVAMWAWAAIRLLEFALTQPCIDKDAICVIGHEDLAEAAILAAALDKRFSFAAASCPYFASTATQRHLYSPGHFKIAHIRSHLLRSAISLYSLVSPRPIIISCIKDDYIGYEEVETAAAEAVESVSYYIKPEMRYLGRKDWNNFMDIIDKKIKTPKMQT